MKLASSGSSDKFTLIKQAKLRPVRDLTSYPFHDSDEIEIRLKKVISRRDSWV